MGIFGASRILQLVWPEAGEHLVGAASEHQRPLLSVHVRCRFLVEIFFGNDPIEIPIGRREVAVGGHAIKHDDSSHNETSIATLADFTPVRPVLLDSALRLSAAYDIRSAQK